MIKSFTMPTYEEFRAACREPTPFSNDPRMGTVTLGPKALWTELTQAKAEADSGNQEANSWCANTLSIFGFVCDCR